MKRGGFWMTTVATGVAVLGLMTVGRAGLRNQAVLFLQGQMKIAAGDTDSGLRLLAEASNRQQGDASATNPLETVSQPKAEKPCRSVDTGKAKLPRPSEAWKGRPVSRTEQSLKVKAAPEPTLASLVAPTIPTPPMVHAPYAQDAMAYIPAAQREQLRAQRAEFEKAQRTREVQLKRAMQQVSYKYDVDVPSAREIQVQIERELRTLAQ